MAIRNDSYIGPIYVPESTEIVPVIKSGSRLSILEKNLNSLESSNLTSASYNSKNVATTIADCSLLDLTVLSGSVTNIVVEYKLSTNNYFTWSNATTLRGLWTASATPYNLRFDIPILYSRNKPGNTKYDFRLSFFGSTTKAKIQPYNDATYATANLAIDLMQSSSQYGPSGSIRLIPHGVSTTIANFPYLTNSCMINRIVTFESSSGATTYYSSQAFCIVSHSNSSPTMSARFMQLLSATSSYNVDGIWGGSSPMFYHSGGKYTASIDNSYIADSNVRFNGVDDFHEIVGVVSNSVLIGSTWYDSGAVADSTAVRIGWKSMYGAPTGWYSCSNPYITYSFNPLLPTIGPVGSVYVNSSSFYNVSEYIIFMWVSTASVSLGDSSTALPSAPFSPGATGSATGGGDWYLYDRIPAPKVLPSGGISGTNPDIEYVVTNLPRTKTTCFWVGTMWENSVINQQDTGRYNYSEIIKPGQHNLSNVLLRTKKETSS